MQEKYKTDFDSNEILASIYIYNNFCNVRPFTFAMQTQIQCQLTAIATRIVKTINTGKIFMR